MKLHMLRVFLATAILVGASALFGQQNATLSGTISDSSGGVIPGVEVTITNSDTGETYTAQTTAVGSYTIPFIKTGNFTLRAESEGFKTYSQPNVRLDTAANARADVIMELGDVTEIVTVEAGVPLLKTENSSVGNVIQNKTIANMPLLGRRAAQLVRLSGFVVQTGTGSNFQIAGGRNNNAMWTLDGGSNQNIMLGVATLTFDPPIEALEEMSVEVSNYKAEMGRSGGGFIQMTTKSGTNSFHGAAYEFLRNDAMDSRQFFAAEKQKLRRNQFGWALGGPIVKNRTFFFASQEWTRESTSAPRIENIPDPAELGGDFSGLSATLRDPVTRAVLANKQVPQSQMDPVGVAVTQFWPTPNISGQPTRNRNYLGLSSTNSPANTLSTRVDHTISDKHRLYGRYVHNYGNRLENSGIWPLEVHNDTRNVDGSYFNWSVTGISNLTNRLVSEARFTWNRRKFHPSMPAQGQGWAERIGLKGTDPEYFPGFGFAGGIQRIGRAGGQERLQVPILDIHVANNYTYISGNHSFKWGGEFRASQNDDENLPSAGGALNFTNNATGDSLAALLYGWTASAARLQTFLIRSRANSLGAFFQDDWKVSSKLTLNLGIRWDLDTPRWEEIDNRQNSFDVAANNPVCDCPGLITWSGRGARGGSKYAHNFVSTNFSPRFGFAYRPSQDWVIRGGGSLVFIGQYDQATPIAANAGFSVQGSFGTLRPTDAAFLLKDGLPAITLPTEADLVAGFGAVPIGTSPTFSPQFFQPEGRPMPYLLTYNLNVQRKLGASTIVEVGYLATIGHKLTIPGSTTLNQIHPSQIHWVDTNNTAPQVLRPFPQFNGVDVLAPTFGDSEYHGLNFKLEKRYADGLQFGLNYTFAKAMDNVEGRDELGGEDGNAPFANQYDQRQAWALGGSHIKHRMITSVVWDIPFGKGRAHSISNPVANAILGGWTAGTILEFRTGAPFSAYWGNASQVYPTAARVRADASGPYAENSDWRSNVRGENYFDTSVFARPQRFTFGNLGRNAFIGPGAIRADASLIKNFYLPMEGHTLEFRAEVINFPNRANFANPNQNVQAGNFGTVNGLIGGASGRILQMGLRYGF